MNNEPNLETQVTAFEKDLKNHGLSIDIDMTRVFKFQSNEEVVVEVVTKEECEVHMIEVRSFFLVVFLFFYRMARSEGKKKCVLLIPMILTCVLVTRARELHLFYAFWHTF